MKQFNTPILFLIFNRPDLTEIVLKRIRKIKPKYLFVAADGPREENKNDIIKCKEARQVTLNLIDWDCEVKTIFRDKNLGCGRAVGEAITWFFKHVEEGIILEDDCLPNLEFFKFCEDLLAYYRSSNEVLHISGNNFQNGKKRGRGSYYFSKYPHCWGWATWRRAWNEFDFHLEDLGFETLRNALVKYESPKKEIKYWLNIQDQLLNNVYDSWSYRWTFKIWQQNGKVILPNENLVSNIGFRPDATHTFSKNSSIDSKNASIKFPLSHVSLKIHRKADLYSFKKHFYNSNSFNNKLKALMKPFIEVIKSIAFRVIYEKYKKFTMIPRGIFISNMRIAYNIKNVPGDIIECGTWKGGMIAGLTHVFGKGKEYHLFDSFEGLPEVADIDGEAAKQWQSDQNGPFYFNNCRAELDDARAAMKKSAATRYELHKGWFKDTLPGFTPTDGIALLRLDADWYESTMDCLANLFPKVNKGGIVVIDDYFMWEGCSKAVHDYLSETKSNCKINEFRGVCYILKR